MVFFFTIPEALPVYMGKDKYENEDLLRFAWQEDVWFHVDNLSSAHVYLRLEFPAEISSKNSPETEISSTKNQTQAETEIVSSKSKNQTQNSSKNQTQTQNSSKNQASNSFAAEGGDFSSNTLLIPAPSFSGLALLDQIPQTALDRMCQLTKANSIEGCKKEEVTIVYTPASNLRKEAGAEIGSVNFHDKKLVRFVKNVRKDAEILKPLLKSKVELFPNLQKERDENEQKKRSVVKQRFADAKKAKIDAEKQVALEGRLWNEARDQFDQREEGAEEKDNGKSYGADEDDFI